jgi:hypothetical protein
VEPSSQTSPGRSLAIPITAGETLPASRGRHPTLSPTKRSAGIPIHRAELVPGKDLSHFAYVKTTSKRNLYRVSLR